MNDETSTEQQHLEGAISVLAALTSGSRQFDAIFIDREKSSKESNKVARIAYERKISLRRVGRDEIDRRANGTTHGGVLAVVGDRAFVELQTLGTQTKSAWIVMIDGVEDPYNFGGAVRALYAAGADGLVLRNRNWMSAAAIVARASAGASELIPTSTADSAEEAAEHFRSRGFTIACATDCGETTSLYSANLRVPLFLMIGGEKRGVTRSFGEQSDLRLEIPYRRADAHSLGTAAAASVIGFEIMRQRIGKFTVPDNSSTKNAAPAQSKLPQRPSTQQESSRLSKQIRSPRKPLRGS